MTRAWRRRRRGRRLRADPAEAHSGRLSARLFQSARLAAAALARRGADPSRHHGRRRRDRRHGDEDGRRPRHRADRHGRAGQDRPRHDHGRAARPAGAARRRSDAAGAGRAGTRRAATDAAAGGGATYAPKIDKSETRIDWSRPWQQVHDHCRGLSPFPGAWCEFPGAGRVKVLRTTKGAGSGKPGEVLDGRLTIACGEGAVRLVELQRAGGKPMGSEEFLRGMPLAPGSMLA